MIVSDVLRRVQRIFGDNTEAQIYVTDVIDWINDGQMEIVRQTDCLTKKLAFDVPNQSTGLNQGPYALPSDFLKEERVAFDDMSLTKTTLQELDQYVSSANKNPMSYDVPAYFYFWQSSLWVYPKATRYGAGLLAIWYVNAPVAVTSQSDALTIPIGYHEDLVRYCLMRAKELNEDYSGSDRLASDFDKRMGASRDDSGNPHTSYPVVRDYDGDVWMNPVY